MNKNETLHQLIEENNGYLLSSMALERKVSKTFLTKYIKENGLERVARGIYITEDVWPDELYIMQARNAKVIFSGETALYLHGLLDRQTGEDMSPVNHFSLANTPCRFCPKALR